MFLGYNFSSALVWPSGDSRQIARERVSCKSGTGSHVPFCASTMVQCTTAQWSGWDLYWMTSIENNMYLTHFILRPSACSFVTCRYIFTLANSFTDFFWIKSAREVSDNFLPHILNVWFKKFLWIFLLFWDGECAQNKRLTWPSVWRWAFWQWICMWRWVCTCRAVRKHPKHD
jgi:hypothetical protein